MALQFPIAHCGTLSNCKVTIIIHKKWVQVIEPQWQLSNYQGTSVKQTAFHHNRVFVQSSQSRRPLKIDWQYYYNSCKHICQIN